MDKDNAVDAEYEDVEDKPMTTAIAIVSPMDAPIEVFREGLDRRRANRSALMAWIKDSLKRGTDYGEIKGKDSLWKPGAEKILGMLGCTADYPNLHKYEEAALEGREIKNIILKCIIRNGDGREIAEGIGARSMSQDRGDLNKCLKMAKKSCLIDATLQAGGLSEIFTQDLEDMFPGDVEDDTTPPPREEKKAEPPKATEKTEDGMSEKQNGMLKSLVGRLDKEAGEKLAKWLERGSHSKKDASEMIKRSLERIDLMKNDEKRGEAPQKPSFRPGDKDDPYTFFLNNCKAAKAAVGEVEYYACLGAMGFEKANQVNPDDEENQRVILEALSDIALAKRDEG